MKNEIFTFKLAFMQMIHCNQNPKAQQASGAATDRSSFGDPLLKPVYCMLLPSPCSAHALAIFDPVRSVFPTLRSHNQNRNRHVH
jgi:hypothetical protein